MPPIPSPESQPRHALHRLSAWALAAALLAPLTGFAQSPSPQAVQAKVADEVAPLLESLKSLVAIESGSRDLEGLDKLAQLVAGRLQASGMTVQTLPAQAPDFHPQLKGAKLGNMVYATRTGTGQRKVLLIAHMDTVYARGMGAKQPFRIEGDRAYGLGISDDKGGLALILHTVKLLDQMGFADYAQLGVLINADEEIGSPGSAAKITQLGSEYDAVLSFEGEGAHSFRALRGLAARGRLVTQGAASALRQRPRHSQVSVSGGPGSPQAGHWQS